VTRHRLAAQERQNRSFHAAGTRAFNAGVGRIGVRLAVRAPGALEILFGALTHEAQFALVFAKRISS
jgi:hypothetical protein